MVNQRIASVVVLGLFFLLVRASFEQSVQPLSSGTERQALIQLRSSLGLRSKEWPIKSDPCFLWVGVECRNGRVVGINISGFKRTRIGSENPQFSVDSLANFTLLTSFNASRFPLSGPIPDWFGMRLGSIRVLDLSFCSITGTIPYSLGNLTNLTILSLPGNKLTGIVPSSLGQLSSLSVLDLSSNLLTGFIPSNFTSLENLTKLDLSANFLAGFIPSAIGSLSKLQIFNLSNNSLSSSIPIQLGNLSSLVDLDLSFNSLSGLVPPELLGLRNLRRMIIGNNLLSGSLPNNLFSSLNQLEFIVLRHNDFAGDFPNMLWTMPELRFLDASGNNFTGTMPNPTSNDNVNATAAAVFNISQNMFYGNLTSIMRRYNVVDISGNYFQGSVPDYARGNASLSTNCLRNVSSQRTAVECASFYTSVGLVFDNFGLPNSTQPPTTTTSQKKSNKIIWIIVGVVSGSLVLIALLIIALIICKRGRRRATNQREVIVGPVPTEGTPPPPGGTSLNFSSLGDAFTYQQIVQATGEFNETNLMKNGHSGDLFRGELEGGISIVIKRIDLSSSKKETHMVELELFSKVSHVRLVPMLGHCLDNENEKFLVYKYMPNGDLSNSLYRKNSTEHDSLQSLDWITRLKIATGAAEGLSYLHHECTPPLVHRDVQASSILLDDKFEVRLGSLSEVCAQEGDAHQNVITRFLRLPQTSEQGASGSPTAPATCAYDVYCFGKVLLELVTGKLGISASSDAAMKEWLEGILPYISIYDKELVTNIIDRSLIIDEDLLEEVWSMAIVARSCLNPKPAKRPLMRYVLKALENPLKVVREEHTGSARLRTASSRGSWNAALFGSWRHSSSDVAAVPAAAAVNKVEGSGSSGVKQGGSSGSPGSGGRNGGSGRSSSTRRNSKDIFPEPYDEREIERIVAVGEE